MKNPTAVSSRTAPLPHWTFRAGLLSCFGGKEGEGIEGINILIIRESKGCMSALSGGEKLDAFPEHTGDRITMPLLGTMISCDLHFPRGSVGVSEEDPPPRGDTTTWLPRFLGLPKQECW